MFEAVLYVALRWKDEPLCSCPAEGMPVDCVVCTFDPSVGSILG